MKLILDVWRQENPLGPGHYETHTVDDAAPEMSILELLDRLNDQLVEEGRDPVAFESDCREGICGACGITVDGQPHGPQRNTPSCHQRLSGYEDGRRIRLEPLRSATYPVIRDLVVDRSALDRVITAGGYVGVPGGAALPAGALPVSHEQAERALDMAACIGCGACVAACPNGSAHLFVGAKLAHLSLLPTGTLARGHRARAMIGEMEQDFGPCSLYGECAQVCPANIPLTAIAAVNKEALRSLLRRKDN
ncbi:MAG: succinate dehydrogenase/fumarate reductase iron-sulfur subunit [Ornithinimicrobium sp.]|uniref:succinate dehydrogenase/fumarate reductase iron-sulfur subunit n=1 Tax=Ornithinimicrobium sp. TaxID=1977084 RepID=UPI0026DED6AC|nr:succinate dehydrogenase/fumarate reductase iron-sulfur subunit [Ornithinimicrobium sp.]MDO5740383.1 succinate dehydrogenase/fumarate reductase iron-sulfur subunit [Ornithinimicrobium sp.]